MKRLSQTKLQGNSSFMMPDERGDAESATNFQQWFGTTQWSTVLAACSPESPEYSSALEKLCRTYWPALYGFIRLQGYGPQDAQDLAQGFFARLLRMNSLADVRREKGKFRSFLLAALKHFLSDERDRLRAQKRGGGQTVISIEGTDAEECYLELPNLDPEPEKSFDRRWALSVMEQALSRIKQEYDSSGRQELFEHLSVFLEAEPSAGDYSALARKLGTSTNGLAAAVYRLRQRFRECIRFELAQTVAGPQDLEDEMSYLFSILSG